MSNRRKARDSKGRQYPTLVPPVEAGAADVDNGPAVIVDEEGGAAPPGWDESWTLATGDVARLQVLSGAGVHGLEALLVATAGQEATARRNVAAVVAELRRQGATWTRIAELYRPGFSRQGAQQRWGRHERSA